MNYEATGIIRSIHNEQSGINQNTGKQWSSLEMLLLVAEGETRDGRHWEELLNFRAFGDIANAIKQFRKEGDKVTVTFSIRTNEWKDRYFTELSPSKVEAASTDGESTEENAPSEAQPQEQAENDGDADALPF